jgi:hypothetical protein
MNYIYTLRDPRNNDIRYIGKTKWLNKRYKTHLEHAKKYGPGSTKKNSWIVKLLNDGILPIMEVLDELDDTTNWQLVEQYWIAQFKAWGFNLTNMTSGGDGLNINKWDDIWSKERQQEILKNRPPVTEYRKIQARERRLGKRFEDIFGTEYAHEIKNKISVSNSKPKTSPPYTRTDEIREKNSINGSKSLYYKITFPDGNIIEFFRQKEVVKYFNELNKNKKRSEWVSPYAILRGDYIDYIVERIKKHE